MLTFRHKTPNGGLSSNENVHTLHACEKTPPKRKKSSATPSNSPNMTKASETTATTTTTDEDVLRTSTDTPSPSTSYNSEATSINSETTSRKFRQNLNTLPSEPLGCHPPVRTGSGGGLAKRKAAMLSRVFKTGSVDLFMTSSTSTVGSSATNAFDKDPPKRKKSGGSGKKFMRRKMSAAKSAIRKFSQAGRGSHTQLDGIKKEISSGDEKSPPIHKYEEGGKTRFLPAPFRNARKFTTCSPPKKKPLGPSLSWDPEHRYFSMRLIEKARFLYKLKSSNLPSKFRKFNFYIFQIKKSVDNLPIEDPFRRLGC